MRGLYAIVDADFLGARGIDLVAFAERAILAKPAVVQVRAKNARPRDVLDWLRKLRGPCDAAGVLLFANDRPDLAVLAGCDGVHVGQDDLGVEEIRRFAPALKIGISTHSEGDVDAALRLRPDYVAYGPVFATTSKVRPDPVVGLAGLEGAARRCRAAAVPLVAIGGIDSSNVGAVARHADLAAVISALLPNEGLDGVTERALSLGILLRGARER